MASHKIEYDGFRRNGTWRTIARCSCRQEMTAGTHQQAEDWALAHQREVDRTQALLRPRAYSPAMLRTDYEYYRQMENDPNNSEKDRALWRQMADEIEPRLPHRKGDSQPEDQEKLF